MYKIEVRHNQEMAFKVVAGKSEFIIDAQGEGVTPLDALLAGLGSCIGVYIRKYALSSKLELKNFKVLVSAELTPGPFSFKLVNVEIDLKSSSLDDRRRFALLEFIKNCPAHNTLKGNPIIEFKLTESN
jgi:uncharacterized OsmC-like protein